jgi:hypothetical protein
MAVLNTILFERIPNTSKSKRLHIFELNAMGLLWRFVANPFIKTLSKAKARKKDFSLA